MSDLVIIGVLLVFVGIVVALASMFQRSEGETKVRGGAVVLVGPIPLVLGSDAKWAFLAALVALVIIVVILFSWRTLV